MARPFEGSTVLVADDDAPIRELLQEILESEGATVRLARSGSEALSMLEEAEPDLAVMDVRMPAPDGMALLQQLRTRGSQVPVIIITAQDSSTLTIEAMQKGAYDYLAKPFNVEDVLQTVERALEYRHLSRRIHVLEQEVHRDPRDTIIGRSAVMQQVYKLIGRVAASDTTVLITGESGTGKELVAQVLHRSSPRRDSPFIAVNCAALTETLLESELFGHEKGAFTGAMAQRKGRFEQAHKGTLFLDEIGDISPNTQKKLLRVLQERVFERVGGNAPIKVDVRVVAATNRDLLQEVNKGSFRDDLYYRLNVINIHMPPLRERRDDISLLVGHFLNKHRFAGTEQSRITESAMQALMDYDWPGNVRQLENTIERAVVLAQGKLINPEHMLLTDNASEQEQILTGALNRLLLQGGTLGSMLDQLRSRLIGLALERAQGDRATVARTLGIDEADMP